MKPAAAAVTDEQQSEPDQGIHQDTNRLGLQRLTINNLPDEVLLEIFDTFRQDVDPYDEKWKRGHSWLNLTHVCGKWRDVMFASPTRLDLGISVGPKKPGHIKTILSGSLPIFLDYRCTDGYLYESQEPEELTGSALWRMRTVLKHHPDRVREIRFEGEWPSFHKFFKMTDGTAFPMLESLYLGLFLFFPEMNAIIPATFLRGPGPDLSNLHHLRRLTVNCIAFASIFDFLLSATALTDLTLVIDTPFGPTPERSLVACLKAMSGLLSLDLTFLSRPAPDDSDSPSSPTEFIHQLPLEEEAVMLKSPEEIVVLPKLKRISYVGDPKVWRVFLRCLRAPTIKHLSIRSYSPTPSRIPQLLITTSEGYNF